MTKTKRLQDYRIGDELDLSSIELTEMSLPKDTKLIVVETKLTSIEKKEFTLCINLVKME